MTQERSNFVSITINSASCFFALKEKDAELILFCRTFGTLAKLVCVINNFYCIAKFLKDRVFYCLCMRQGKSIGVPLNMQEANKIVLDPHFTIFTALVTAFLPGQPPQVLIPITSMCSVIPSKASFFSLIIFKQAVVGHISSV